MNIKLTIMVFCGVLFVSCFTSLQVGAQEGLRIYGPGGPAPAIKELAGIFQKQHSTVITVVAGPSSKWIEQAKQDADIIYSGSENMMNGFVKQMEGNIIESTITPLYLRPSTILVRPGNPKDINNLKDILTPGIKILVVEGAGQTGLWEDVAGRLGEIETVKAFRNNIVYVAPNSGVAKQYWIKYSDVDAWLIWTHWQVANPELADMVVVEREYRIYRDCGIALTKRAESNTLASRFIYFVQTDQGAAVFKKWGWTTGSSR